MKRMPSQESSVPELHLRDLRCAGFRQFVFPKILKYATQVKFREAKIWECDVFFVPQGFQRSAKAVVIPFGDLRQPVVRNGKCDRIRILNLQPHNGHGLELQSLGCQPAGVPSYDSKLCVTDDGDVEAEPLDAPRNGFNSLVVESRILSPRFECPWIHVCDPKAIPCRFPHVSSPFQA